MEKKDERICIKMEIFSIFHLAGNLAWWEYYYRISNSIFSVCWKGKYNYSCYADTTNLAISVCSNWKWLGKWMEQNGKLFYDFLSPGQLDDSDLGNCKRKTQIIILYVYVVWAIVINSDELLIIVARESRGQKISMDRNGIRSVEMPFIRRASAELHDVFCVNPFHLEINKGAEWSFHSKSI